MPCVFYLFSQLFSSYHFKEEEKGGESAITEIIEKILKESGIKGVVVNSRIIYVFRKKNWLLKSKVKQMSYFVGTEFDMGGKFDFFFLAHSTSGGFSVHRAVVLHFANGNYEKNSARAAMSIDVFTVNLTSAYRNSPAPTVYMIKTYPA